MKALDTPLRPLLGRTAREAILVAGGLAICVGELRQTPANPWHVGLFAAGTALFAVRFFAARVVAIGVLLSAIAAHLSAMRYGAGWVSAPLFWGVYPMAAGVVLLMSRDLQQRFDLAPTGVGFRLNRWRELPRSHWRASTLLGWLLGLLGHFLLRGWQSSGADPTTWPLLAIVLCIAGVLLLFTGRSIVFVITAVLGIAVAIAVIPQVAGAETLLHNAFRAPASLDALWRRSPDSALMTAVAAVGVAVVSLPYAVLHLWNGLRPR